MAERSIQPPSAHDYHEGVSRQHTLGSVCAHAYGARRSRLLVCVFSVCMYACMNRGCGCRGPDRGTTFGGQGVSPAACAATEPPQRAAQHPRGRVPLRFLLLRDSCGHHDALGHWGRRRRHSAGTCMQSMQSILSLVDIHHAVFQSVLQFAVQI